MIREGQRSITKLFSDGSPSNNTGGEQTREQKLIAKSKAMSAARIATTLRVSGTPPQAAGTDSIEAEQRPQGEKVTWNPNSKYSGAGRLIQAVPFLKRNAERFVAAGNQYSSLDEKTRDEFSNLPSAKDPLVQLERDQLIAAGFLDEVTIVALTEAKLRKKDKGYEKSKLTISNFLNKQQRSAKVNLKSNRMFALKSLSNPQDERMYSSLGILYFYCERL